MYLHEAKLKDTFIVTGFSKDKDIRRRLMDIGVKIGSKFKIIIMHKNGSLVLNNDDLKIVLDKTACSNIKIDIITKPLTIPQNKSINK